MDRTDYRYKKHCLTCNVTLHSDESDGRDVIRVPNANASNGCHSRHSSLPLNNKRYNWRKNSPLNQPFTIMRNV